jgi:hypothetical protein
LLLRFPRLADFTISQDERSIAVRPEPGTPPETIRHLLLDQVLPRVLAQEGQLVLHASAVRVGEVAIAFIADSGGGKSTLAASLHRAGFAVLADDGLVVEPGEIGATALPTYTGLRLWPASAQALVSDTKSLSPMAHYSTKKRVTVNAAGRPERRPLSAIYLLKAPVADVGAPQGAVVVSPVSARAACLALIAQSFRLDVTDGRQTAVQFDLASRIASQVPMFTLSYPRDFSRLPDVHAAIVG